MCDVLRCDQPGGGIVVIPIGDGAPRFEAVACDEHRDRIENGEKWVWNDEDRCILMGADLDAGGAVVLGDWQLVEQLGLSELVVQRRTPSGVPLEPLRVWMSRDELTDYIRSFRHALPGAFNTDS